MEIVVCHDANHGAHLAADLIGVHIKQLVDPIPCRRRSIGLATGGSMAGLYAELGRRHAVDPFDVRALRLVLLDEYVGLPVGHAQLFQTLLWKDFGGPLGFSKDQFLGPDVFAEDLPAACDRFEQAIRDGGGVDIQLLGIGSNGHIGFNEPGSSLASRTRTVRLADATRADNARYFPSGDHVPREAVTQGIATILEAQALVLIAFGGRKAPAIKRALRGPVADEAPASALQLHPHLTVIVDDGAASQLFS